MPTGKYARFKRHKEKLSNAHLGKLHTDKHKENIRRSLKAWWKLHRKGFDELPIEQKLTILLKYTKYVEACEGKAESLYDWYLNIFNK